MLTLVFTMGGPALVNHKLYLEGLIILRQRTWRTVMQVRRSISLDRP